MVDIGGVYFKLEAFRSLAMILHFYLFEFSMYLYDTQIY